MVKDNLKKYFHNCIKKTCGFSKKTLQIIVNTNLSTNLKTRIISGTIMFVVAIIAICFSKNLFFLLIIVITILMTFEWLELIKEVEDKRKWQLIGLVYILIPMFSLLKLREFNFNILLWVFAVICATDIFAYFTGKNFGGAKLMPTVSPNKTWLGLAGGVIASIVIGFLSSFMFSGSIIFFIMISATLSVIEQISDLIESKIKRILGVKDSSNIIPGHGGILDRLDGIILVAPTALFFIYYYSENFITK